jgi:hypothetical protein
MVNQAYGKPYLFLLYEMVQEVEILASINLYIIFLRNIIPLLPNTMDHQWRAEGGIGGSNRPPPKIPKFYKVEQDCKLSGKCLVFLFQHPN